MFLIKVNQAVDNKRTFHWRIWSENKKQGTAFCWHRSPCNMFCVQPPSPLPKSASLSLSLSHLKQIELRCSRNLFFFCLPKGHKSNVIIAHSCGKGKHMPGDDMNIQALNCCCFMTESISLTKACEAAQFETLFRLTSAWPPEAPLRLAPHENSRRPCIRAGITHCIDEVALIRWI